MRNTALKLAGLLAVAALCLTGASKKHVYSAREKAFYASPSAVEFVRPGLTITINSAQIASDGTISVEYTLTDPNGLPLDASGVTTPGAISLSYLAAVLPNDQDEYTAYTTRAASGAAVASVNRPSADSGGARTQTGPGQYRVRFPHEGAHWVRCGRHAHHRHLRIASTDRFRPGHKLREHRVQLRPQRIEGNQGS